MNQKHHRLTGDNLQNVSYSNVEVVAHLSEARTFGDNLKKKKRHLQTFPPAQSLINSKVTGSQDSSSATLHLMNIGITVWIKPELDV